MPDDAGTLTPALNASPVRNEGNGLPVTRSSGQHLRAAAAVLDPARNGGRGRLFCEAPPWLSAKTLGFHSAGSTRPEPNQALQATSVTRGVFGKVSVFDRTQRGA